MSTQVESLTPRDRHASVALGVVSRRLRAASSTSDVQAAVQYGSGLAAGLSIANLIDGPGLDALQREVSELGNQRLLQMRGQVAA